MTAIEVYADVWCPFAHVGLRAVVRRRHELARDDTPLRILAWPLELVNNGPLDPRTTEEHIVDLRSQVATEMFTGFDVGHFPKTTLPALALAASAYRRNDIVGEAVSLALRDALFERGQDISEPDVLAGIALAHGIDGGGPLARQDVLDEWHKGEARGVKGSPHFFCGDLESFCPALGISRTDSGELHIVRDAEALNAYLDRCFDRGDLPAAT